MLLMFNGDTPHYVLNQRLLAGSTFPMFKVGINYHCDKPAKRLKRSHNASAVPSPAPSSAPSPAPSSAPCSPHSFAPHSFAPPFFVPVSAPSSVPCIASSFRSLAPSPLPYLAPPSLTSEVSECNVGSLDDPLFDVETLETRDFCTFAQVALEEVAQLALREDTLATEADSSLYALDMRELENHDILDWLAPQSTPIRRTQTSLTTPLKTAGLQSRP